MVSTRQHFRRRFVRSLGVLVLTVVVLGACGARKDGTGILRPGRIILFSMDTVRADRVSGWGGDNTPNLLAIAAEGVRFARAYSASGYTIPAHMSVFTGLDPIEHGVFEEYGRADPGVQMLAELLKEAGYKTQAFHEGGYVDRRFGFARGFDEYEGRSRITVVGSQLPEVLGWIRGNAETPYFLFLHTYAAHYPYGGWQRFRAENPGRGLPSDEEIAQWRQAALAGDARQLTREQRKLAILYNNFAVRRVDTIPVVGHRFRRDFIESEHFAVDRKGLLESYDERIGVIDSALGTLRDTLMDLGQWEDTLLIVFSDHGEAFFEHSRHGHNYVPFDEGIRVPLVVSWPRVIRDRYRVVEEPVWHLDLFPTILRLAGVESPEGTRGMDLTPVLLGEEEIDSNRTVFPIVSRLPGRADEPPRRVAVRGDLKWIQGHELFGDPEGLLFDLSSDPLETKNLRTRKPDEFESLARSARVYEAGLTRSNPVHQRTGKLLEENERPARGFELTPEELADLQELGYVIEERNEEGEW